jgi:hypothetical protein
MPRWVGVPRYVQAIAARIATLIATPTISAG